MPFEPGFDEAATVLSQVHPGEDDRLSRFHVFEGLEGHSLQGDFHVEALPVEVGLFSYLGPNDIAFHQFFELFLLFLLFCLFLALIEDVFLHASHKEVFEKLAVCPFWLELRVVLNS